MSSINRRHFLKFAGATSLAAVLPLSFSFSRSAFAANQKVVIIGGGLGGATCAKYLKLWGGSSIDVTLIEPNPTYVAAPGSNLVLTTGNAAVTKTYSALTSRGIKVIQGTANHLQNCTNTGGTVVLSNTTTQDYNVLVIAPGIGWYNPPVGWDASKDPHAWRVGDPGDSTHATQLDLLKSKLAALKANGSGKVVIRIPKTPFRATAAPYSRIATIANYLGKPFKVIVLDHNSGVTLSNNSVTPSVSVQTGIQGEAQLFYNEFQRLHGLGILDYYWGVDAATENLDFGNTGNNNRLLSWEALGDLNTLATATPTLTSNSATLNQKDVLNYIPDQKAGDFLSTGQIPWLAAPARWATVDPLTYVMQGLSVSNIHVLGDSSNAAAPLPPPVTTPITPIAAAKSIPKGGHMANSQAKVCANAILNALAGNAVDTNITVVSTGFDPISNTQALYSTAVYQYEAPSTAAYPASAYPLGDMAKKQWNTTTSVFDPAAATFGLPTAASTQYISDMNSWVNSLLNDSFT